MELNPVTRVAMEFLLVLSIKWLQQGFTAALYMDTFCVFGPYVEEYSTEL